MDVIYSEDVAVWDGVLLFMQKVQNVKWTDFNLMLQEDPETIQNNPYGLVEHLKPITKKLILDRRLINQLSSLNYIE